MKHSAATRAGLAVALLLPLVAAALAAGLATGAGELSLRAALNGQEPDATVLFRLRVPRVLLAAEVGAALSVAGVALQALLRNPLADPFVFGLSGGAAVGTAIVVAASGTAVGAAAFSAASFVGLLPAQLAAVAGALTAALFVFALGRSRGQLEPTRALLVGVVFNSFASAIVLSMESILQPDQTQAVLLWLSGTLGYEAMPLLAGAGIALLVPALVLIALAGRLNLLALGDEGAAALGVDVSRTRLLAFFAASAAVGIAVAFTGLVGFVGLVVPHAVRLVVGPDHRVVLPASALGGAAFLVLADALARVLFRGLGAEPPVGAVTAIIGAPLFVMLLRSRR
ncbi:MAG: iron ABC transporter permease [Deltaproteobacteria bacterium]|nr:MAG: iron ABC transporter permease [Deltaproteobacteria bacterium]